MTTTPRTSSTQEASRWAVTVGRVGVAAVGVLYLLLAFVTGQIALGRSSGGQASSSGALSTLAGEPLGVALLVLLALGFLAFVAWQVFEAFGRGLVRDPSVLDRVKAAGKAVVAAVLLATTVRVIASGGSGGGSEGEEQAASTILGWPGGQLLVGAIGVGVVAFAGYLVYRGVTGKIREKLEGGVDRRLIRLGQVGDVARGGAFAVIGVLVVVAAVRYDAEQAGGLDTALLELREQPFGRVIVLAIALGFAAWGVFCVLTARRHKEG